MEERTKAIINIVIAFAVLINAILTAAGRNPIPINENAVAEVISYTAAGLETLWIWWKNQNLTPEAITAQKIADEMKADREMAGGEGDPLGDERGAENEWD